MDLINTTIAKSGVNGREISLMDPLRSCPRQSPCLPPSSRLMEVQNSTAPEIDWPKSHLASFWTKNQMKPTRGALIVLEGLDRAGKSSQCRLLHDKLHSLGIPVRLIKFPGSSVRYLSFSLLTRLEVCARRRIFPQFDAPAPHNHTFR